MGRKRKREGEGESVPPKRQKTEEGTHDQEAKSEESGDLAAVREEVEPELELEPEDEEKEEAKAEADAASEADGAQSAQSDGDAGAGPSGSKKGDSDAEPKKKVKVRDPNRHEERAKRKAEKAHHKKEEDEKRRKAKEATKTAKAAAAKRIRPTVSVALPGSVIDNAQSPELRTALAGQIARAMAIFRIDEVIVFSEKGLQGDSKKAPAGMSDCNTFLARILQYLETPQYLRKNLIPITPDLRFSGLLAPLDTPHHMRGDEWTQHREGVVLARPTGSKENAGSWVNVGLLKECQIDRKVKPGVRVTVDMGKTEAESMRKGTYRGKAVPPTAPRDAGTYWGYTTRMAGSLSEVFTGGPYETGYDLTVGTSERGRNIYDADFALPEFKHLLLVFGGVHGLEESVEADPALEGIDSPSVLFHHYLNTCPSQGSRTIRLEEALLISLAALQPFLFAS